MMSLRAIILVAASAIAGVIFVNHAHAGTITVTLGFDRFDSNANSGCSLREAIQAANTNAAFAGCQAGTPGNDVIVFTNTLTTVTISRTVNGSNEDNDDGDLDVYVGSVSGTLTIQGPITVEVDNAALSDRAFDIHLNGSASSAFTMTQVTVRGGRVTFATTEDTSSGADQETCRYGGGGVRVRGSVTATLESARVEDNIAAYSGGGICAREGARLVLTGTTVVSNTVGLSGTVVISHAVGGGGVWSMGDTWLTNTFVLTNRAVLSGSYYELAGGGGVGVLTGTLTVYSTTVRGNIAEQNANLGEANGGGVMAARRSGGTSSVRIENARIEDNQSLNGRVSYGGGIALIRGVRVEMRNTIIARNVLSAAELALGGGGAFGLSYEPHGYQPPTAELDGVTFENNTATVSISSVDKQITPTVFGGGVFFGWNTTFTVTASTVQSNAIRYIGESITNTNGLGGGLSTLNHTSGLISGTDVLSNTAEDFRFIGGAGMQTKGEQSRVINSRASGNYGIPSPANDWGGVFGGGYYVDYHPSGVAHILGSRFERNVITRTSGNSFTSGGGLGVDGRAFITHTHVQSNTATQGGGMGFGGGSEAVARWVTVTHNLAQHHGFAEGGGVTGAGDVEIRDSLIAHNVVTSTYTAVGGGVSRYAGNLRLINVTIRDNQAQSEWWTATGGGGAFGGGTTHLTHTSVLSNIARSANQEGHSGGLHNNATLLRVVTSTIAYNRAVGNNDGSSGGGLGNTGNAEVIDSLVAYNRVELSNGSVTGGGGGIVNGENGVLTVTHSSIVGNQAYNAAAINTYSTYTATLTLTPTTRIVNSTFSGNDTTSLGANVTLIGTAYLTHTTIASNTGDGLGYSGVNINAYGVLIAYNRYNCTTWGGSALNAAHSLSSDNSCPAGFTNNTDPLLQPLALNGGATPNHALLPGSPALEGVPTCGASEDQRGVSRPQGPQCDIGAFELEATDLEVSKSVTPTNPQTGDVLTYTIVITNLSSFDAEEVTLTDTISGGASFGGVFNAGGFTLHSSTSNQAVFTRSVLISGTSATIVFTATATQGGLVTNTVTVISKRPDSNLSNNTAQVTTTVQASADLELAKSAAGNTAIAGQPFTYTLTITNNGPLTATEVVITDALSGGATFSAVVTSTNPASLTHNFSGGQATFTVTNIAPGAVFTIVYTVLPPVNGGVFSNTAVISSSTPTDPNPGNDSGGGGQFNGAANADLTINKSATPTVVEPGGVVTFTLTVTNNGPSNAQFITVTDVLSGGSFGGVVDTSSGVNVSVSGNSVTFTVNILSASNAITMVYTATAPSFGVLTNTAVVTSAVGDFGSDSNQDGMTVTVNAIDLALEKSAAGGTAIAGQPFTYTLTITNNGPLTATEVVITDALSGGATFSAVVTSTNPASLTHNFSGGQATFTVTNIAPGAVFTIVYTVLPPVNGGVFSNTAVISSSTPTDPNPGNDSGGGQFNGAANADLTITKSATPTIVEPGGVVTFTLTVTNNGPSDAQFITVTDVLSGSSFGGVVDTSSGVNVSVSGNSATFTVSSLSAGSAVTMVYTATAPLSGALSNTAIVTSAVGDLSGDDNQASVTIQVQASTTTLTVTKQQTYTLSVGSTIRHYGLVTYTITVTNTGTATATSVVITDALSTALSFVSASTGCAHSGGVVTCTLSELGSGQSISVQIVAQATGTPGSLVSNAAQTSASNAPEVSSNPVSARIEYKAFMPIVRRLAMVYIPIVYRPSP